LYDELNRIKTNDQFSETYSYDNRGNRQSLENNTNFDSIGADYGYDKRDQLTSVITTDGKNVNYKYNGDGLLYERTENGVTIRFYYDGANVIAEANVVGGIATLKSRYIRGSTGLIARQDAAGNKSYYLANGHSDIVELRDSNGTIQNQYSYDIWGNPLITSGPVENPFRYSGEYWDKSTSLQYLRARWYDPSIGRFINEDTYEGDITNPLSLNLYTYVGNNPLTYFDPTGNVPESKELFDLNLKINQLKIDWDFANNNMKLFNEGSAIYNSLKTARDSAAASAQKIRADNSSVSGLLKSTDKVQTVIPIDFKTAFAGGVTETSLIRVANNGTVYYPLPIGSESTAEDVVVETKGNAMVSTASKGIADTLGMKSPIGNIATFILGGDSTDIPKVGTTTTMVYIEQDDLLYHAVFTTLGNKMLSHSFWAIYGTFLRYRLHDDIYVKY
jgi:RHS repeat-associated protein